MRTRYWIALAAAAVAACAPAPPNPVPVSAGSGSTATLVGEWVGEYESPALGRAGSIVFHLDAGRDTAQGDVMMVPRGSGQAPQHLPAGEPGAVMRAMLAPQVLTIRFVRLEGNRVTGALDPYLDPGCGCRVFTAFEGTLAGERLHGTFVTRGEPRGPVNGRWSVERRAP
jgi:hypothetical protein